MRKCFSIFLFFLFILFSHNAFAGSTTLTTFYPPPTAVYNKVSLSTNATAAPTSICPKLYCNGEPPGSPGTIFLYTGTPSTACPSASYAPGTLYLCGEAGTATTYCTAAINGAIIADTNGTLHVCMNGQDTIYPQECYNSFCSYDNSQYASTDSTNPCCSWMNPAASCTTIHQTCQNGFNQMQVQALPGTGSANQPWAPLPAPGSKAHPAFSNFYDWFNTTAHTTVLSIVCCSGVAGTSSPPGSTYGSGCPNCTPPTTFPGGVDPGGGSNPSTTPDNDARGSPTGVNCAIGCTVPLTCVSGTCQCVPGTGCATSGTPCGPDQCGNANGCGSCTSPDTCGGGTPGVPGVCGCTPTTCQALGYSCGTPPDGCGGTLPSCGSCPANDSCASGVCTCDTQMCLGTCLPLGYVCCSDGPCSTACQGNGTCGSSS